MAKHSKDEKKRDEILKRMLQSPHKPHVVKKAKVAKKTPEKSGAKRIGRNSDR